MKVEKNRTINFKYSRLTTEELYHRLDDQLDTKAMLLWMSAHINFLIQGGYFHSIALEESTDDYYCRLIVRYAPQYDQVTVTYFEKRF